MRCDWNLAKTQFGIVLEYFRPRKEGTELRLFLTKQKGRENKVKTKGSKVKGKKKGKVKGKELSLPSRKRVSK